MSSILHKLLPSGFSGGVHPDDAKDFSADAAIEILPTPKEIAIPLLQHTGSPSESLVKPRQEVTRGETIAKATGFVSAAAHAPVNGVVGQPGVTTLPNGRHVKTITIQPSGEQLEGEALRRDVLGGDYPLTGLDKYEPRAIVEAIAAAGIVGLGGAAFPTHVKLTPNDKKPIDTILVNGCECEPYLTDDYRVMLESPTAVLCGALLAARAAGAGRVVVAIESNKPQALAAMREAAARGLTGNGHTQLEIQALPTKYPMGGEKQTARAALGRTIPTGGLPLDVGVVVINVGTCWAVARAVVQAKALTHRVVTVTGAGVARCANVLVPIGVSYQAVLDHCGGLKPGAGRVISGGPMMGFAVGDLSAVITKGTSGITVLSEEDIQREQETPCVRCGRCVEVCPVDLMPTRIALACRREDWDVARRHHIMACMECGCCSFICPARIPLAQLIRTGKSRLPKT